MLLIDGLYAKGPIMQICREYRWQFMITLKDDSLPSVWEEYNALVDFGSNQNNRHCRKWGNRRQKFIWVNDIGYLYDQDTKEQIVHRHEWFEFQRKAHQGDLL